MRTTTTARLSSLSSSHSGTTKGGARGEALSLSLSWSYPSWSTLSCRRDVWNFNDMDEQRGGEGWGSGCGLVLYNRILAILLNPWLVPPSMYACSSPFTDLQVNPSPPPPFYLSSFLLLAFVWIIYEKKRHLLSLCSTWCMSQLQLRMTYICINIRGRNLIPAN